MPEKLNRVQIGAFLKKLRLRKGLSQYEIATQVEVASINFISMLENGKATIPMDKFKKYMKAYGATHEESLFFFGSNWPDAWEAVCHLDHTCGTLFREYNLDEAYNVCSHSH
jgi:transcriptional regulator with XRE-family HTH domain